MHNFVKVKTFYQINLANLFELLVRMWRRGGGGADTVHLNTVAVDTVFKALVYLLLILYLPAPCVLIDVFTAL